MVMIHTDICGPIVPKTFAGEQYFMTLIDDYSRFTEVRLLKRKSDAASELKNFCQLNPSVKKIRCDNGKEYVDGEFLKFANEAGIKIDPSPPYTPCLNGVAERANRSLLEKGRAMIFESNLPKNFWGFAVLTAAYINNRMPNTSIDCHTPYYLKYNTHADLKNLRVFGCDAYTLIPNSQRKKLDDKCKKMIFIGYSSMGYRLLDPTTKRIIISKNVKFNEEKKSSNDFNYVSPNIDGSELDAENESEESEIDIFVPSTEQSEDTSEGTVRKSSREKKHPIRFPESEIYQAMLSQEETVKFDDISTLPHSEQQNWKAALDEEMESMKENDVWDLEELPMDRKAISCRWVLRKKRDGKYKARLVARGFMQKGGVDYFETFSPVISMPALRLLLIIMLNENSNVLVLDVKTAFLNGELNETIYMDQPKGYDDNTGRKCKLKKSLYGLKQAPRQWYQKFLNFVNKIGFKQLNSESCIFIRQVNSNKIFMALYVDDLLLGGSDVQEINVIVDMLSKEFKMSKSEKASEFLGIRIEFISDNLFLDQESYILRLLKKYKMLDCNTSSIPIETKATAATFEKDLSLYVDADWGSNSNDRKSISGYLIMFCNNPILWCVNKQKCIALSSTEAEIIALSKGVQDLLWIKGIASEIVCVKNLMVYEDNQSCIKCIANENNFGRMKHIDIKLKFIRDIVSRNKIKIEYISTGNQIADMLTKALPKTKFCELLKLCNFKI
ncbi:Retrovirus-related Pol polyprotein from transposon TNT 1-94 [Araneus ventricosus]|uniref:Retrovirus-related Pol polyprotein from transposon TNT 1-94 n=1 Tax=Araneus ventricosus TaxID=182803 RepID=A0A4Y2J2K0_ARAVE|nr:Retrovirus-related Pol polyprotein from transposon TNT 1-94 [Araneus ventricosus]GBM98785.1 Retrovirus-related Pol polyprotein from transposon TNT 1-94 [Araneus ventricosus]